LGACGENGSLEHGMLGPIEAEEVSQAAAGGHAAGDFGALARIVEFVDLK